jgi:flagellar motor switch protein FliN/FliY
MAEQSPADTQVKKAELSAISAEGSAAKAGSIDMLMDVSLDVTIELGRTMMSIKDILNLSVGSVIELDKMAGDPVDILVNNKLIARGEVVVIDRISACVLPR